MKEFLVFYYIVLAIALSITIPICYYCNQIDKRQENKYEKLERTQPYFRKACTDGTFELYFTEDSPKWMRPLRDNNYNTYIRFKK